MAMNKKTMPQWFELGDQLMWPLIGMACTSARNHKMPTLDTDGVAELAVCHHAGCLEASGYANRRGKHSTAISLVRQSIEALTVAEVGLQEAEFAEPLLQDWLKGRKSQGQLRQALEADIWPTYGTGLWDEKWAEFYANLARAVQPYAHYTQELQGWQYAVVSHDMESSFIAMTGLGTYDPTQASRVTLFHMLLTYMLGRILLVHGHNLDVCAREEAITKLGSALSESRLLFRKRNWGLQLAPHMLFRGGYRPDDDN
jgi:hypothetical protein